MRPAFTMLDHVGVTVPKSKFDQVITWYAAAFAPLGYLKQIEFPGIAVGFGTSKLTADFWVQARDDANAKGTTHIALKGETHEIVDKFHEEAVKAGGTCNGKPGIRTMYHPSYYAAFVFDPVGNNIEVVDHKPHE